jgi:hypothetical protein
MRIRWIHSFTCGENTSDVFSASAPSHGGTRPLLLPHPPTPLNTNNPIVERGEAYILEVVHPLSSSSVMSPLVYQSFTDGRRSSTLVVEPTHLFTGVQIISKTFSHSDKKLFVQFFFGQISREVEHHPQAYCWVQVPQSGYKEFAKRRGIKVREA